MKKFCLISFLVLVFSLLGSSEVSFASSHSTIPKIFRGTWYTYMGKEKWSATKYTAHSILGFNVNKAGKRISKYYWKSTPRSKGFNKLYVTRQAANHSNEPNTIDRVNYSFTKGDGGMHWIGKIKIHGKYYQELCDFESGPEYVNVSLRYRYPHDFTHVY